MLFHSKNSGGLVLRILFCALICSVSCLASATAPSRSVKFQAVVHRAWQEKLADGSFQLKTEIVCTVTSQVNLYEVRSGEPYSPETIPAGSCRTKLKEGWGIVKIYGFMVVTRDVSDPFKPGHQINWKSAYSYFEVQSTDGKFNEIAPGHRTVSEDLKQKVFIHFDNLTSIESFTTAIRFED